MAEITSKDMPESGEMLLKNLERDLDRMYKLGFNHALAWALPFLSPLVQLKARELKLFDRKMQEELK